MWLCPLSFLTTLRGAGIEEVRTGNVVLIAGGRVVQMLIGRFSLPLTVSEGLTEEALASDGRVRVRSSWKESKDVRYESVFSSTAEVGVDATGGFTGKYTIGLTNFSASAVSLSRCLLALTGFKFANSGAFAVSDALAGGGSDGLGSAGSSSNENFLRPRDLRCAWLAACSG